MDFWNFLDLLLYNSSLEQCSFTQCRLFLGQSRTLCENLLYIHIFGSFTILHRIMYVPSYVMYSLLLVGKKKKKEERGKMVLVLHIL